MEMDAIIIRENEDSSYSVKVAGREIYEVSSTDYTVAMSRARDLLHRNGGGTVIVKNKNDKTINTEDVK